jgi:hypothetical protein
VVTEVAKWPIEQNEVPPTTGSEIVPITPPLPPSKPLLIKAAPPAPPASRTLGSGKACPSSWREMNKDPSLRHWLFVANLLQSLHPLVT